MRAYLVPKVRRCYADQLLVDTVVVVVAAPGGVVAVRSFDYTFHPVEGDDAAGIVDSSSSLCCCYY